MALWTDDDVMMALKDMLPVERHGGDPTGSVPLLCHGDGGVSIDTRTLTPGDVFVALQGPKTDGHLWAREALILGASTVIVARGVVPLSDLLSVGRGVVIQVPDTLKALEALARYGRDRTAARVIGVTGSFGKTTMKDTLAALLSQKGQVSASQRSFNNHWGVPLTLCGIRPTSTFAVVEMGMNHRGEIAHLSRLVRPHLSIITTIQAMHVANLGSIEGVCDAKTEMIQGMADDGTLILNADDAMYPRARGTADGRGLSVMTFSDRRPDADVHLITCQDEIGSFLVTASVCGHKVDYRVPGFADHLVRFSLGVAAVLAVLGPDYIPLMAGFDRFFVVPEGRGRLYQVPYQGGVIHVIDDSYNAGPDSMVAALQTLSKLAKKTGGRALAVLGDMGELGDRGPALHRGLKGVLERLQIDRVYTSGPLMRGLFDEIIPAMGGYHDDHVLGLMPAVLADLRPGDVILVKGSKGQYAERGRMYAVTHGLLTLNEQG